jgi:Zn-dependent protease
LSLPDIGLVLAEFVVFVLSLSFHEAAHAWTADRLGDPTARMLGRLTLNPLVHIDWIGTVVFPLVGMLSGVPLIGWAKPVPVNIHALRRPREDFAIVALAGPVSNLLLAGLGALLYRSVALTTMNAEPSLGLAITAAALQFIVLINCLLAVFNMIPVPPLDGGNVLMGLVPARAAATIGWLRPYGVLILYALVFTGGLAVLMRPVHALVSLLL